MFVNLRTYIFVALFLSCNLFFSANTSIALDTSAGEQYYGINAETLYIFKLDNAEKSKAEETTVEEKETKGKMNVYFCGCYGDEWKQPVGEPVHEMCPICGMGTKGTGCGNLLKTE
ncbi:MAG: hypothetical protein ACE5KZ_11345 [Candidatus Scalinduaceae bacterium]